MGANGTGPAYGIIVAAGRSERMGGIDKVFTPLMGRPLLAWTLTAFKKCDTIDGIIIVAAPQSVERMHAFVGEWRFPKIAAIVAGGAVRQESVRAGIDAAGEATVVAVHDAARPLVTPEMIAEGVAIAREMGAAVCGTPARDTIKTTGGDPAMITGTTDRAGTWIAHTPQVFNRALLLDAHERAGAAATDDAALVEALGKSVRMYEGSAWNLKVTTPDDLVVAEALLRERFAT